MVLYCHENEDESIIYYYCTLPIQDQWTTQARCRVVEKTMYAHSHSSGQFQCSQCPNCGRTFYSIVDIIICLHCGNIVSKVPGHFELILGYDKKDVLE